MPGFTREIEVWEIVCGKGNNYFLIKGIKL